MKKSKSNEPLRVNDVFGGYRADAQEYNQLINDYIERLNVIRESNEKRKIN